MGFLSDTETAVQGLEYIINTTRNSEIFMDSIWRLENLYMSLEDYNSVRANTLREHITRILKVSASIDISDHLTDGVNNTFCGVIGALGFGVMMAGLYILSYPSNVIRW